MTIIYNKSNGNVILMMSEKIEAVSSVMSDIPDGYIVSSVNTETGEVVLEEIPKSSEQVQIDDLKKIVAELKVSSDEQKRITDVIIGAEESEETV